MPIAFVPFKLVICGLDQINAHCTSDISHIVSILDPGYDKPEALARFAAHERIDLRFHDIIDEHDQMTAPQRDDIDRLLQFGRSMLQSPSAINVLIHCHAGLSRSTAAALLLLMQGQPRQSPETTMTQLLEIKPNAWPNLRMIEIGDDLLGCAGQLVVAVRHHYASLVERYPIIERALSAGRHLRG
jgi:predicted protein tyrosine phosphatase